MKKLPLLLFCVASVLLANSQSAFLQWQKTFGGGNGDTCHAVIQTNDGGYALAGSSVSNNGNVSGNHGNSDFWIVKLDNTGAIEWQKSLGGSSSDMACSIVQTSDSGYVIAGSTYSTGGNVTGNHGGADYWVVKINRTGTLLWQKALGGSADDFANAITKTTDGGFAVTGYSNSGDGDVTVNHNSSDFWTAKLDSTGALQWQVSFGGSGDDRANSIVQTLDGGYAMAGYSESGDGDVTGNQGAADYWIVKTDIAGNLQWQKSFGGTMPEQCQSILQTNDSSYVLAGSANSNDGDVTGGHGSGDYWVVKLNSTGILQWQKTFGGNGYDQAYSIARKADGDYIVAGLADSDNGDVSDNHGSGDYWVVSLDSLGVMQWKKSFGGTLREVAYAVTRGNDGGFVVAGSAQSNDGDVSGNHGGTDYWVIKIGACELTPPVITLSGPATFCEGDSVVLTSSYSSGNYWSQGDTTHSIAVYTAGVYVDTLRNISGCAVSAATTVVVNTNPSASVSPSSVTICQGGNVQLTANGGGTYAWSNSLGSSASPTVSAVSNTTYTVTVTNGNNCSATASSDVIIDNPVASISPDTLSACTGIAYSLTASSASTYAWSNSLGGTQQVTIYPTQNTVYTVTVTSLYNCTATASSVVTIDVPTPTISPTGVTICKGASATFTASGGNTYVWSNSLGTNPQVTVSPSSTGTYQVTATDLNLCYAVASVTVTVNEPADQSLCMVTVDSNSTHNVLVWEKTNQEAIDSFYIYREITTGNYSKIGAVHRDSLSEYHDYAANPNVTAYRYRISVKDTCGNEGVQSDYHNSIHLQYLGTGNLQWNVYSIENSSTPVSSFDVYKDSTGTGNWALLVSVPGSQTTTTDVNYSQHPNIRYRVVANWSFSCTPTRSSYATVYSNVKALAQTGIEETEYANVFVYPNPASNNLFIQANDIAITEINIYNATGSLVSKTHGWLQNNSIDISELSAGVYVAEIKSKESSIKKRWLKM